MADLFLRLIGDPTSAASAFSDVSGMVRTLGQAVIQFSKDSVKAYSEAERAEKQLARVAGEMTDAFKAQASALQESLGVSDDLVVKMQAMLLRFGEAPDKVDATVRALLDYSAATGVDAVQATRELLVAVESGRAAFKELGLQVKLTGNASDDAAAYTEALASVVGGAAGADSETLAGRTRKAAEAWGDLQKAFGEFLAEAEARFGVLEELAEKIRAVKNAMTGQPQTGGPGRERGRMMEELESLKASRAQWESLPLEEKSRFFREFQGGAQSLPGEWSKRIEQLEAELFGSAGGWQPWAPFTQTQRAGRTTAAGRRAAGAGGGEGGPGRTLEYGFTVAGVEPSEYGMLAEEDRINKATEEALARANEQLEEELGSEARAQKLAAAQNKALEEAEKRVREQQERAWEMAGASIGASFVGALSGELEKLMAGGPMDAGETVGAVLATILAVAGSALGMALGGPAGAALGGALGGLASTVVRGATKKKHDGGWVERFHGGGWPGLAADEVPIIAQSGEMVLSRRDVSRMGGPAGVEQARAGGGVTVNVSTFDGATAAEYFSRSGGRALADAVRGGRGMMPVLLGVR